MRLTVLRGAAAVAAMLAASAAAQDLPEQPGPERTVKLFDLFCYAHLPDLDAVADIAAAGGFAELEGDELELYRPDAEAEALRAWRFDDFGAEFVLSTARSLPDDAFKADVPEFADSTSYACSLVIDNDDPAEALLDRTATLVGRAPDETWEQPPLRAHAWTGQTEELLVVLLYYAPLDGGTGGTLTSSVFVKN